MAEVLRSLFLRATDGFGRLRQIGLDADPHGETSGVKEQARGP